MNDNISNIEIITHNGFIFSLVRDLKQTAEARLYIAYFSLKLPVKEVQIWTEFIELLNRMAKEKKLKIITNKETLGRLPFAVLQSVRIPDSSVFVHSKTVLVHPDIVYLGSLNFTPYLNQRAINHVLRIRNLNLYSRLVTEFDKFFENFLNLKN